MESIQKEIVQLVEAIIALGFLGTCGLWVLRAWLISREYNRKYDIYRKDSKGRYGL